MGKNIINNTSPFLIAPSFMGCPFLIAPSVFSIVYSYLPVYDPHIRVLAHMGR